MEPKPAAPATTFGALRGGVLANRRAALARVALTVSREAKTTRDKRARFATNSSGLGLRRFGFHIILYADATAARHRPLLSGLWAAFCTR